MLNTLFMLPTIPIFAVFSVSSFNWQVGLGTGLAITIISFAVITVAFAPGLGPAIVAATAFGVAGGAIAGFYWGQDKNGVGVTANTGLPRKLNTPNPSTPSSPKTKSPQTLMNDYEIHIYFISQNENVEAAVPFKCCIFKAYQTGKQSGREVLVTAKNAFGFYNEFERTIRDCLESLRQRESNNQKTIITFFLKPDPGSPVIERLKKIIEEVATNVRPSNPLIFRFQREKRQLNTNSNERYR